MLLRARVQCVSVEHAPASKYVGKDGKEREKGQSWECLIRAESSQYSRLKKATIRCTEETLLESKVELRPGEYDIVVEPAIAFDNLRLTIIEAHPVTKPTKT